jgi:hypothetical protein
VLRRRCRRPSMRVRSAMRLSRADDEGHVAQRSVAPGPGEIFKGRPRVSLLPRARSSCVLPATRHVQQSLVCAPGWPSPLRR